MSVQQQGSATGAGAALVTSIACNVPAGVLAGYFLIWQIVQSITTAPATDPAGWTRLAFTPGAANSGSWTWYRISPGGEPASYTSPTLSSGQTATTMAAFSGVDPNTPFDVTKPAAVQGTTATTFPAITPVTAGAMILALGTDEYAASATVGTITSSNATMIGSNASTGAASSIHVISSMARFAWSSGAFTPAMSSSAATTRTIGESIALRPAPQQRQVIFPPMRNAVLRSATY